MFPGLVCVQKLFLANKSSWFSPTWTVFRQAPRVLQQRPVRRMVRLLSPWAMLPRELPLVRLLLLLLRLGLLLVLVACLCALR